MLIRVFALLVATAVTATPRARAQQAPAATAQSDTARTNLQARVRQRLAAVVKQRLNLTDDQMRQLTAVNTAYEGRRRALLVQERDARTAVRAELQRGPSADQKRIETSLSDLFRAQRARIDLAEQEQRDLAKFLQPSQRAGYLALEEQVRRRVDQMRQGRGGGGAGQRRPGAGGAPPR
jgi:Spy/CpxP family protein refolding chaperone